MTSTETAAKPADTGFKIADEAPPVGTNAVALVAPPRLPWGPQIAERFGVDRATWRVLIDAVWPGARTTDAVVLALSYCRARKLDPMKRVVHIVPVWDSKQNREVETVWPGIADHRITAMRTGLYAGADPAAYGPTIKQAFAGKTQKGPVAAEVSFPEWCQITIYRLAGAMRNPVPGPRVYWPRKRRRWRGSTP